MERKKALTDLCEYALRLLAEFETTIPAAELNDRGSYESWSPKDMTAHIAYWLDRDIASLDMESGTAPWISEEDLEEHNQKVFETYRDASWTDVREYFIDVFSRSKEILASMSEEELNDDIVRSDGSTRAIWRAIAGHAGMHMSSHFAMVSRRRGDLEGATAIEEKASELLLLVDDSSTWKGTIRYNTACHYALSGSTAKAIELLNEAFALRDELIDLSKNDPDFDSLRGIRDFEALYNG